MISKQSFVGNWNFKKWVQDPNKQLPESIFSEGTLIEITPHGESDCKFQFTKTIFGDLGGLTLPLKYSNEMLSAKNLHIEVNGKPIPLKSVTARLVLTVDLEADGIGEGNVGTFTAEAHPGSGSDGGPERRPGCLGWLASLLGRRS